MVTWDKMSDIKGWEKGGDEEQVLRNHLYNKDKKGAWRRDVDIEIVREMQEEPDDKDTHDCTSLPDYCVAMENGPDSDASDTDVDESESESENESEGEGASEGEEEWV